MRRHEAICRCVVPEYDPASNNVYAALPLIVHRRDSNGIIFDEHVIRRAEGARWRIRIYLALIIYKSATLRREHCVMIYYSIDIPNRMIFVHINRPIVAAAHIEGVVIDAQLLHSSESRNAAS